MSDGRSREEQILAQARQSGRLALVGAFVQDRDLVSRLTETMQQTSSEKAQVIAERYQNTIRADKTHCLGSFVFYWSERQEMTHTWYGLFRAGQRTESIDMMQHFWSGAWPVNRAPAIQDLGINEFADLRSVSLQAGKTDRAEAQVTDPDGDPPEFAWDIRPEVEIPVGS